MDPLAPHAALRGPGLRHTVTEQDVERGRMHRGGGRPGPRAAGHGAGSPEVPEPVSRSPGGTPVLCRWPGTNALSFAWCISAAGGPGPHPSHPRAHLQGRGSVGQGRKPLLQGVQPVAQGEQLLPHVQPPLLPLAPLPFPGEQGRTVGVGSNRASLPTQAPALGLPSPAPQPRMPQAPRLHATAQRTPGAGPSRTTRPQRWHPVLPTSQHPQDCPPPARCPRLPQVAGGVLPPPLPPRLCPARSGLGESLR